MASVADIAALRLLIAEPDVETYTDAMLGAEIDADDGDLNKAAFNIWTQKAARSAELVDISEGGSSRKMGDIYEQALSMAKHFAGLIIGGEPEPLSRTRVHKLTRP